MQQPENHEASEDSELTLEKSHVASKRGIAIALPTQGCRLLVHFATICILSRLLSAEDFGIAGMVLAITGFLDLFKDAGLGVALIQAKELPPRLVSTLLWIVSTISLFLCGVMLCSGPALAWLYREPRVSGVSPILAVAVLANGLAVIPQSLLRRELQFGKLAFIEIAAMLAGVSSAIVAALNHSAYFALAFQPLVNSLFVFGLSWILRPVRLMRPSWEPETWNALHVGGHLVGFSFVNYWARNLDQVLIGRYWGAAPLGLYARAYTLLLAPLNLINTPLANVYVPLLSRLATNPSAFRTQYLRGLSLATSVSLPLSATLIVCSEEVVALLLGPHWSHVSTIFRCLCISAPLQFICNSTGWIFQSLGRTDRQFRWGCFACPILIISFFIGLPWGPEGVALAYSCILFPIGILGLIYATIDTEITFVDILQNSRQGFLIACGLAAILGSTKMLPIDASLHWVAGLARLATGGIVIGLSLLLQLRSRTSSDVSVAPLTPSELLK